MSVPVLCCAFSAERSRRPPRRERRRKPRPSTDERRRRSEQGLLPAQPNRRPTRILPRPETARTSEPILIPKLRIGFADFPYLHCSIGQRLFTLETCCGFGYGLGGKSCCLPRIFKGQRRCTGRRMKRDALRMQRPYLWTSQFQGVRSLQRKENSSRDRRWRLRVRLRYRTGVRKPNLPRQVREY